jgi:diguanylate cyclase (GGDEF)-like protein
MQAAFCLLVVVLLGVRVFTYRSVNAAADSARWVQHSSMVLEHLANLRAAIGKFQSGYRDFALSGNEGFLTLSADGLKSVDSELNTLDLLTADNPLQQARLTAVKQLKLTMLERGEASARRERRLGTPNLMDVDTVQEDPKLQEFRAVTVQMQDEEHRLLVLRNAKMERHNRDSRFALLLGSALALLIVTASGWRVMRDVAKREKAEDKLRQLNRLYAMVSGINALTVRVGNRDELFKKSCELAVEHGQFEMAWIGVIDREAMKIIPAAWAGADEQPMIAVRSFFASSAGALQGDSMAARAIRDKVTLVSNDVKNDVSLVLGKMHADSGVRSMANVPLIVGDVAIGVLALYAKKREFFDTAGIQLLSELAGNVAFAIDHIEKQERLDRFAYYDTVTGLANRSLFLDRVTQQMLGATSSGYKLAVFLIDLERFKKFNDTLGRASGDALLMQVADWLVKNVGNVNVLARVGADHFAVVLSDVMYETDVVRGLEKVIANFMRHPFRLNDDVYRIAAKVGVALFPDDGADADTLFKNAEAALKKAKVGGERYLFYAKKMSDTATGSLGIETRLRQALENEEFVLHYQPKVSLATGKLTGAEALIRWNDPKTGLVPPASFIAILEETRLIHEVGRWAMRKSVADYQRWRTLGLPAVRIAVNVSPLQLRSRSFVTEVAEAIGGSAEAAAGLELEITESLIMEDVTHSIASLLAIRALGVTTAIDDFGTGFSSLSYLSRLPVDTLKIDRSFVIDMVTGTGGLTLVSVIINLAHALKLKVVAEGVETEEQLRQLKLLHCDEMQGYLYGKPVPIEIFESKYLARPVRRVVA